MSRFDDIQRDYLEAVNQVRTSFGMDPTDNASDGAWEVMANYSPESINSYSDDSAQSTAQPESYQQTPGLGISDPNTVSPSSSAISSNEKWYAGDRPTYAESVARLYAMQGMLPPEQFNALTAELDKMKHDLSSGFYQNWYETITSPYVNAIAKLGIDVSGGINDEWIAKNQYLLAGARYTDAGTSPAFAKSDTAAQKAAYYYDKIAEEWQQTKTVLQQEEALKNEFAYWVGRDDLNLSDQQILDLIDWDKKYSFLKGLNDAQRNPESSNYGKRWDYVQPIDYNPDNLLGMIWAARNNGGTGNSELDAINAALGRGNVWQENKEISDKLTFGNDNFAPYTVKSTLDEPARYFGKKEFEPGWAEKVAKNIDLNNPEEVKNWKLVYNAEKFTAQAEAEVKTMYDRIDYLIEKDYTDPEEIVNGLLDKWSDKDPALTALQKLDASLVLPDKLLDTTRPINYSKKGVLDYINQEVAKKTGKESLPEFSSQMSQMMNANNSPAPTGTSSPTPILVPTPTPGVNPTDQPRGTDISAADRILHTPAPNFTPTPTPTPMPTPAPVVDQSARAVNKAQTKNVLDAAKTILATGTPDEKQVLNLAPTVNAEGVAAEMANSVQNGKADAGSLYESTAKQAQEFTATHYAMAKMAIQHYEDLQANLANLQAQQAEIQKQHDQVQYQVDRGIVPGVASKEVQIDGETHVLTADYDPTSREYIINDSNPTSSAEVERQKEEYADTLRYGLNMEETYAEKDNQLLVAAEDLNMQLTAINQQVAKAQKAVDDYKMRYDQAQGELKTSQSMINAAAMQSVWKANPDMDLSTPEGQKALAKALDQQNTLTKSIDLLMGVSNTYVPTEWTATTVLDNMQANGFDSQQTGLAAKGIIGEANKELAALDQAEAAVQAAGIAIPGDSNNIKRAREQAQQKKQEAEDYLQRRNEDFGQVVSDAKEAIRSDVDGKKYGALAHYAVDPNLDQPTTTLAENLGMLAQAGNLNSYDAVQPHRQSYMDALTQEERDTYLYKLAKEGEQAAWDYYNRLGKYVDVRQTQAQNEELAAFAKDMPVLAAITSIGISPDTIKGAGYVAASLISGREINPYSKFFDTTWATSTLDQNAKEKILEPLEEGSLAKKIAGIGYDAITSGAKSLLNTALTAPLAGGSAFLGALPMGIQAAGAAAQQTKLTGGSDVQAALMAGVTLAAETLSETITTQNIAKAIDSGAKGVKGAVRKVLSNDLVEEFFGESATQLVEGLTDDAIMGELSQRNQKIKDYEQTMSHEEAVRQADKDFWADVLTAGVTGALSAVGTSGAGYVAGRLTATPNTTQPSAESQVRATALANGLPLDRATVDMTNRTVSMLTSSLNADKGSQVQALSAALFPVSGDTQGQRAAVSAGLHLANRMGAEQAVAVAQDVILAAEQEGADQQAVKEALRTAALGQGEASAVLNRISQNGVEFGDVQALIDAANRDAEKPAIADRMQAIIHNDRVASRTRDLIGQGALNGVKPYEQAYSQAKAQEAQTQQNLEAEQERAQAMGENLKTVQAQHAENPSNPALAGAMKQAVKDVAGQVKVVGEYQQSLENQQQKTREAEKNLNRVREEAMTKVREQAMADVQAEEQAEAEAAAEAQAAAEAAALAEAEAQAQAEQAPASNPNAGTVYTNDQVPVSYHWALVPASDLVTSNTDTGEANSAYPAELQPRDRTRAASQDQVAGMVRNLNPARLGESADVQNGAPIVGPDNVVESGNARTMAIRQAMASNPESAARYTQYVRDNAARFGLNPDDVTDNSVLVRVRDTDLDRVTFARAANESTTATYSPSENAQGDADRLTPRMMELFAPSDTGRLDTTENHAFALAFLNEIIPESERGAYMQDDGSISQQGYDRIRNAVFQRAYGSTALTQALTEDTDGSARNVMNALLKAAPRMMALQDAVDQGGVYDTGLAQAVAAAAERYMQLKNAGMSVEAYLEQTAMPGIQTEDEATQSFMRLFEEYRRSGKKLSEALTNIADAVEDAGDPRAVSFLGRNEAPPLTELIRQGVERMLRPKDSLVSAYRGTDQDAMRVGNNGNATTGNIVSPQETIRNVTDALGITNDTRIKKYLRAQRKTSRGYTMNNGIIHLKSAQAAGVAMHEIGHNLDVRLGLQAMNGNMPQLVLDYCANIDPNLPLKYSGKKLNEEVMADFTRIWALDRNAAVNLAGEDFVQKYENALKDNGWLKAMQTAGEQMRNWNAASSMEQAESHVQLEPPKPRKEKLSLTKTRTDLADHTLPMEAVIRAITNSSKTPSMAKNARELILARPSIVKDFTDTTLYDAMVDPQGNDVLRDDGTKYGGLSDIMKQIDRKDEKAFNTYRLALLDVNRKAQNKGVFDDSMDSAKLVKEYETKYPHFKKVSDQLTEWYNKFFQVWLVDTGIKTQQEFDTMRKLYPDYVPLHAAEDSINKPSGKPRTDGNPANVLERAFASDVDKYNPIMGLVENVQKYITTAKTIEAYRAFDQMMKQAMDDHLDVSAFAEPAQPDMEKIDQRRAKRNITEVAKNAMEGMQLTGDVSQIGSQAVLDAIAGVADFDYVVHDTATGYDVVNIPMANGSVHSWTIYNPSLLKALTMTGSQGETNKVLRALATLKNIFSANVTARSLKFSGQNVFSDMEEAATTGRTGYNNIMKDILAGSRPAHTAKEIAAGLSLLKNKFAETALGEKLGMKTSDAYKMFKRFGMLGSRYAFRDTKTQKETRNALYGGHKSLGEAIVDGLKAIGTLKPLETVTGFGEEMTRYNAFAFSGFDLSTYEGRLQAAKAQREASTDFSKFGAASDNTAFRIFGSTVPFLNAQIQGIDKMVDIMSEIKNDPKRRAVLAGRIAVNSLLSGAVVAALRNIAWGDDEKEGYEDLTDYEKTKFIHLFRWPDGSWFKMKRSQNMLVQAADLLGEFIGEVSTGYEGDAFADLANGAVEIVKNGMVSTDTSLQPLLDAFNGKNWWGGDIDTYNERQMSMTARYGADTSKAARVISTLTFGAISPNGVEYALKQFMGSAGTLGTAILDTAVNSFNDKRFNGQALLNFVNDEVIGGYIVDPVYSNKIATTFYDGKERLEQIKKEYEAGKAPAAFRANLTQEESNSAAKELEAMLSKGGAVYDANKQYSDVKKEYNAVMSDDTTLTPVQQAEKARELRHQMNVALLTANAAMGDFFTKYGYNSIFDQAVQNTLNILSDDTMKKVPDADASSGSTDIRQNRVTTTNAPDDVRKNRTTKTDKEDVRKNRVNP